LLASKKLSKSWSTHTIINASPTEKKKHMKGSWKAKRKQVHEMEPKNRPCSSHEKASGGN
jgi:hypothetical protein